MSGPKWPVTATPDEPVNDFIGNPVNKGDKIVVAFGLSSHGAELRIGIVQGFTYENSYRPGITKRNPITGVWDMVVRPPQDKTPQIVVEWQEQTGYSSMARKTTKIYMDLKRYLVIS
jgi:hypothetical protein